MKPMLAENADLSKVVFPVYASPKIDGIRALIKDGCVVTRTLKAVPNGYISDYLSREELDGLDGELVVGSETDKNCMQVTTSGVMSRDGEPNFTYWVFDFWAQPDTPYNERYRMLCNAFEYEQSVIRSYPRVRLLPQTRIHGLDELREFEERMLEAGFEGVMIRSMDSPYKYGRSTQKQGYLLKVKRFKDAEAYVIGVQELMHNENEATTDELGYVKRSTEAAGKVPGGVLGSLKCQDVKTGVQFDIGSGFTAEQRADLWSKREEIVSQVVKYKYFDVGVKEAPRFPTFIGFRHEDDCDDLIPF